MPVKWTFVAAVMLGMPLSLSVAKAQDSSPAVVLEWNEVLRGWPAVSPGVLPQAIGGPLQGRTYAMVHIAMFDAANSIARAYTPFHVSVAASSGASLEAAAAQAAHDVMTGLFGQQASFDATLSARLATIAPGRRSQGIAVGQAVAARVLAWRADDGSADVGPVYAPPLVAGQWQPTVPGANATLTQTPDATPFAIVSTTQFLPPRHPEINSTHYAADFNEVKEVGAVDSATRTPYQTETALLWAGTPTLTSTNLFHVWNGVMRDTVMMPTQQLSLLEAARSFALMNASMYDGILTSMTGKLVYGLWRQWDAIRRAADDLNPATDPDPTWSPLLATPPYPTYPGNMACLGAAAARSLQLVADTDTADLSVTWRGVPPYADFTREYDGYWQLAQEEADSRIYGGIHFRFDNVASQAQCAKVAEWVAGRVKPRR
ncbi:MAG TPA: vanadium-dependent haloperoxidase [Steroidobacteraceae bacterium]|nr:vanadium-dependent haloperoxidase [Steroidobacteraceae bacterium]